MSEHQMGKGGGQEPENQFQPAAPGEEGAKALAMAVETGLISGHSQGEAT